MAEVDMTYVIITITVSMNYIPIAAICTVVDTSTTLLDDRVTVRLNDSCVENPTTFVSSLSYGSCP